MPLGLGVVHIYLQLEPVGGAENVGSGASDCVSQAKGLLLTRIDSQKLKNEKRDVA